MEINCNLSEKRFSLSGHRRVFQKRSISKALISPHAIVFRQKYGPADIFQAHRDAQVIMGNDSKGIWTIQMFCFSDYKAPCKYVPTILGKNNFLLQVCMSDPYPFPIIFKTGIYIWHSCILSFKYLAFVFQFS